MNSEKCVTCGQRIIHGNIAFGRLYAKMLWMAVNKARTLEAKWKADRADSSSQTLSEMVPRAFLAKDFDKAGLPTTLYNNLSKLRHWGLSSQRAEWWHQGIYQLTDKAYDFVKGRLKVHRELTVKGNLVVGASEEKIDYQQSWGKSWPEIADHIMTWRKGQSNGQEELF